MKNLIARAAATIAAAMLLGPPGPGNEFSPYFDLSDRISQYILTGKWRA